MKYKKILTWACTAALFLTGCTTDTASNGGWMDDSNAVRIQASAGSTLTRSNPTETDESKLTGFNQGDKISVRNRNITVNYTSMVKNYGCRKMTSIWYGTRTT